MIRLHNTLSGHTEDFKPLKQGHVGMYNCGPTVYSYAHIGNLRAYIFADTLRRLFEYEGFTVKQVINITDVGHLTSDADEGEDKMESGAKREGKSAYKVATFYTEAFYKDLAELNIETNGTLFPKATEHIKEQIALIEALEQKGYTYVTSDGVYFDTSKFPAYGALGNIDLAGLREGARVEANTEKRNITDFALWKLSPPGTKREMEWKSPWGTGFPGWHVECSAMSMKYLGETFDVHTGGVDHIPTHHQAEIAQSEAATGRKFVDYWLHNEFMKVDGQKMSKSLGNTYLLSELMEKDFFPLAYRYFLLQSHYRTQTNFTWEALGAAQNAYRKLKQYVSSLPKESFFSRGKVNEIYKNDFKSALENDLNTPEALAVVWKLISDASVSQKDKRATLLNFDQVLGLNLADNEFAVTDVPQAVQALLRDREAARAAKDYTKSDELRNEINALGYEVKDTQEGQILSRI